MGQAIELSSVPASAQEEGVRTGGGHSAVMRLVDTLRKRKWLLIAVVLAGTSLGTALSLMLTPRYTSEAVLEIDSRKQQLVNVNPIVSDLPTDRSILWSVIWAEVERVGSPAISWQVVRRLGLAEDPEFNDKQSFSFLDPQNWLTWVKELPHLSKSSDEEAPSPALAASVRLLEQRHRDWELPSTPGDIAVVSAFRSHLKVWPDHTSGLIHITFTSRSPGKAQAIVGAIVDTYLAVQIQEKQRETKEAVDWLRNSLRDLQSEVDTAERAVENFRSEAHLSTTRGNSLTEQQLVEVNSQLVSVQAEEAAVAARLEKTQKLLSNPSLLESSRDALDSRVIQLLRESEAQEASYQAKLREHYGPAHPEVIQSDAAMAQIRGKIKAEVARTVAALSNELGVAKARSAVLQKRVADLQEAVVSVNSSEVRFHELERQAQASRELYSSFLQRFKELTTQLGIQKSDARIILAPELPTDPSFPRRRLLTAGALIASLGFGVLLALTLETHRFSIQTLEELQQVLGYKTLGIMPISRHLPQLEPRSERGSAEETLQGIHTSLVLGKHDANVIQITSAIPEEGKSTFALTLGRLVAQSGKRVLIVDFDLARPSLHLKTSVPASLGIAEVLEGKVALRDVIHDDPISEAQLIFAGGKPSHHPADLLSSSQALQIVESLRHAYDLVIFDSPPVLAVTDARLIARLADATIFVVQWRRASRKVILGAVQQLEEAGASILGTVLARVHLKKYSRYYGQDLYYSIAYSRAR